MGVKEMPRKWYVRKHLQEGKRQNKELPENRLKVGKNYKIITQKSQQQVQQREYIM